MTSSTWCEYQILLHVVTGRQGRPRCDGARSRPVNDSIASERRNGGLLRSEDTRIVSPTHCRRQRVVSMVVEPFLGILPEGLIPRLRRRRPPYPGQNPSSSFPVDQRFGGARSRHWKRAGHGRTEPEDVMSGRCERYHGD